MGSGTTIEWTDASWNPVVGCSLVSPGCTNCYAMRMAARLEAIGTPHYAGTTKTVNGKPVWTGKVALAPDHILTAPLRWREPRMVFVNSMSDLFHEDVPDAWIDLVFAIMARAPQHTFQVLTKRTARMRKYCDNRGQPAAKRISRLAPQCPVVWPLPNVWLGVSAEDQTRADARIPDLRATPAAVKFISAEPLLGPIDLPLDGIDWVIVGGESGPGARPMHPDWVRSIRDQCAHERASRDRRREGPFEDGEAAAGACDGRRCGRVGRPDLRLLCGDRFRRSETGRSATAGRVSLGQRQPRRDSDARDGVRVMRSDPLVDLTMILHHETERAVLVSDDGDRRKAMWLPKSQIEIEHKPNGVVVVTLPKRLAVDKGLV